MTQTNDADAHKSVQDKLRDGLDHARTAASDAYGATSKRVGSAYGSATEGLDANPLGVLVGGLAVGALVGALLPRSDREKQMLAPVGRKLGETARGAIQAARDAGYAELDQRGLTKEAARDQVKGLFQGVGQALSAAGAAGAKSAGGHSDHAANDGAPQGGAQPQATA